MAVAVPIPMGIRDRVIYQTLVKLARVLQRSAIITLESSGTVDITEDLSVSNTPNYSLQESFSVNTGVTWEDYNNDTSVYDFSAGFTSGNVGFTPGDPKEPSVYLSNTIQPVSLSDLEPTVYVLVELWVRGIDSIGAGSSFTWKAKKIN